MTYTEAYRAFCEADDAWQAQLEAAFGKEAGDARFEERGKGEPGTDLRAAYEARDAARISFDRVRRGVPA